MFSIVIPTYNRAIKLEKCLTSLINQTYKNFEVIISDDGSDDNTEKVVEEARRKGLSIKYIYNQNWGGPGRPRNIAIKNAQFEWVCFLDSDDWWYADKLKLILPYCNQNNDLIYHDFELYRKGKLTNRKHKGRQLKKPVFNDLFINDNCIVNSGVCIRKSVLEKVGGFSEDRDLIAIEDFDLWLKCARITEKFKYVPEILGGYEISDDSITTNNTGLINRFDKLFALHKQYLNPSEIRLAEINWSYKKAVIYQSMSKTDCARKYYLMATRSNFLPIKLKAGFRLFTMLIKRG